MKKHGIAIPMVIVLAAILGLISTFVVKGIRQYNQSNQTSYAQLQAYFIARAGVEHAMLKTKFLHRELYDAICLSQGRNPLFDYSLIKDNDLLGAIKPYNPGPIFLYTKGSFSKQTGVYTDNFEIKNGGEKTNELWLKTFMADLVSTPEANEYGTNKVLNLNNLDESIKKELHEPFKFAEYKVSKLNIAAQQVNESSAIVENNIIVEMVIDSSILTARGKEANKEEETWNYQIKKTIKVSRD